MTDLPPYGLTNMPVPDWDRVLDVNLRGPLLCTQAVIESMTERGGGRIINGLSAGAFMAGGIYGVSKYALHGLTCNLATELGSRGINVNGIAPGLVASESGYVSLPKDSPFRDVLAAQIPGKTSGPPADLVGTMLLLCSPAGTGSTARRSRSTAAGSCGSDENDGRVDDARGTGAVARAEYEHIMTSASPDRAGAYIESGVIGYVFGEMWRRGVLTPRDRRWITLTCVGAAGAITPIETHVYAALKAGTSRIRSSTSLSCTSARRPAGPRRRPCRCTE